MDLPLPLLVGLDSINHLGEVLAVMLLPSLRGLPYPLLSLFPLLGQWLLKLLDKLPGQLALELSLPMYLAFMLQAILPLLLVADPQRELTES